MADNISQQNDKKTVVAFIVGLLIGGLLVWAFSGPSASAPAKSEKKDAAKEMTNKDGDEEKDDAEAADEEVKKDAAPVVATLPVGDGKVTVSKKTAGSLVELSNVTYPVGEGWVGVRDYADGRLGMLLGVARFSKEQGLVPEAVILQRPTKAGNDYAVVMYNESGDRAFNLAEDTQIDQVFANFTAE